MISLSFLSCASDKKYKDLSYYKNGKFQNLHPEKEKKGFWSYLGLMFADDKAAKWPSKVALKKLERRKTERSIKPKITFINHATFLIQVDNINILTDPVFSKRVSPFNWIGPKRVIDPGIPKEELPKIDLILISHDHYDHLDYDSIQYFKNRDNPKIYAGLEVGKINKNFAVIEMKWWEEIIEKDYLIAFTPSQHFSGRGFSDRYESLWGGFYFKSKHLSFYFAGDSGYSDHFKQVYDRYGSADLALLPIGAYEPRWFAKYLHMNPEDAMKAHSDLRPGLSLGMHWGTFQLTYEPRMEPVQLIKKLSKEKKILNFKVLEFGEELEL